MDSLRLAELAACGVGASGGKKDLISGAKGLVVPSSPKFEFMRRWLQYDVEGDGINLSDVARAARNRCPEVLGALTNRRSRVTDREIGQLMRDVLW
jgi:hypothetical protein